MLKEDNVLPFVGFAKLLIKLCDSLEEKRNYCLYFSYRLSEDWQMGLTDEAIIVVVVLYPLAFSQKCN